jgi:hypothetical protein
MSVGESSTTAANLGAGLDACNALIAGQRLLLLDDLWTGYLEGADPDDPAAIERDLPQLRRLVSEMVGGLRELAPHLHLVRNAIEDLGSETVDGTLAAMLSCASHDEARMETLREQLGDFDVRGAVIEACDYLEAIGGETEREVESKLQTLAGGHFQKGDFKLPVRCAVYLFTAGACIVGGSVVVVATGAIATAPAWAGAAIAALRAWGGQRCPGAMSEISFGRRG